MTTTTFPNSIGITIFDQSTTTQTVCRARPSPPAPPADSDVLLLLSGRGTIGLNGVAPANFSQGFVL